MSTKKPHKREVGEFEIRVLKNGKVVMIAPDEKLLEVAENIKDQESNMKNEQSPCDETKGNNH
jgi:hypothetical protein